MFDVQWKGKALTWFQRAELEWWRRDECHVQSEPFEQLPVTLDVSLTRQSRSGCRDSDILA
jgi:hypothetical protein